MKRLQFLKMIVSILVIVIIAANVSLDTFALINGGKERKIDADSYMKKSRHPKVVKELKELRTTNSTTYLLDNGSRKIEISGVDTRYEENGKLIDYNTKLKNMAKRDRKRLQKLTDKHVENTEIEKYSYVNTAGDAKHYFPNIINERTGVLLEKGGNIIEFAPIMSNVEEKSVDGSSIIYVANEQNVEYKYTSYEDGVKEDIILKEKPDSNVFKFRINKSGIELEINEYSEEIKIRDELTGKVIAYIAEPNIKDVDSGEKFEEVSYELEENKNSYVLKIVVDNEYLKSKDTNYPVTIDPTLVWMDSRLESATISSFVGHRDINLKNGASFEVQNKAITKVPYTGCEYRCYISTTSIPYTGSMEQFYGTFVESASLKIVEQGDYPNNTGTIEVRTPVGTWNPNTVTYSNCPAMGSEVWAAFSTAGAKNTMHQVDLTEWAQAIANREIENYGLILKAKETGTRATFYGSSLSNLNYMRLSIVYWPYTYNVNNYYDMAFATRYGAAGNVPVKMSEAFELASQVFEKNFELKIFTNTPTQIISTADQCKIDSGIGINTDTINQRCQVTENHKSHCTAPWKIYGNFIGKYPGNSTTASILWTGNKLFDNNGYETDRSFKSYDNGILLARMCNYDSYYYEIMPVLTHELAHVFGAPDHYHEEIDSEGTCRNPDYCKTCNPETGRDESCIMNTLENVDIENDNSYLIFCKDCANDIKLYIENNLN